MPNTYEVILTNTAWTEVAGSGTAGYITVEGAGKIKYRENDVLPTDEIAHTLELGKDIVSNVNFSMVAGQKVYCKSVEAESKISVTLN